MVLRVQNLNPQLPAFSLNLPSYDLMSNSKNLKSANPENKKSSEKSRSAEPIQIAQVKGKKEVAPETQTTSRSQGISDNGVVQEAIRISEDTATKQQFTEAYQTLTGKKPDAKILRMIEEFKSNPLKLLRNSSTDLIDMISLKAGLSGIDFTLNPSQKASVESAKATVLNTYNNIAWAATGREQLATSNDQLKVQREALKVSRSSLSAQEKALQISNLTLKLAERNEQRQQRALEIQEFQASLQSAGLKETKAYNKTALNNQARALALQERAIDQVAENARKAYDLSEKLAADSIANINLNAAQRRVFDRATTQENSYNTAKVNWNAERGSTTIYKNQQMVSYDKDGWVIPSAFNDGLGRLMTLSERLTILNRRKQATPRPDFVKLEREFKAQSNSLITKPQINKRSEGDKPSSIRSNSYFSASEIKLNQSVLAKSLKSGEFNTYINKVREYQQGGATTQAFDRRVIELRIIVESTPPKITGPDRQIYAAAQRMIDRLTKLPPPNQEQFIKDSRGTVNAYFGR
jgi:hypothetical protein